MLLILLLAAACTADAQTSSQKAENNPEARIAVDVGIMVSDMDQSLAFYRGVLGLTVVADIRTSLIGKGRMVQLQHGASLIKLVQMDESIQSETQTGITTTLGFRYITLMVDDIEAIVATLDAAGAPIALPLTELGNGAKILMVEDPAGNIVEFVQEAG